MKTRFVYSEAYILSVAKIMSVDLFDKHHTVKTIIELGTSHVSSIYHDGTLMQYTKIAMGNSCC